MSWTLRPGEEPTGEALAKVIERCVSTGSDRLIRCGLHSAEEVIDYS